MQFSRTPLTILVIVITTLLLNACTTTGPAYTAGGMFKDIEGAGDLWSDVRRGMDIDIPNNSRVEEQVDYLLRKKSFLDSMQRNARPYLYEVVTELKRRDMPMELALLPAIESGYRTTAYSRSGAAGIWQFIRSTGDYYGLKRTKYVDMRRDPQAATQAALDYLQYLHKFFDGDWHLAIAAYNGGEGTVSRAQKANAARGLKTDFWSLSLRKETMDYVPRLLAISKIIKNPGRYDYTVYRIPKTRVLSTVSTTRAIDLKEAARRSDMDPNAFSALNARYVRHVTEPGKSNSIIVPRHKYSQFKVVLAGMPEAQTQGVFSRVASTSRKSKTVTHRVNKGETLSGIARQYGVSVASIKQANNLRGNDIRIGQNLKVSGTSKSSSRTSTASSSTKPTTYTVKSGDSLYAIARQYGSTADRIRKDNNLSGNNIRVGQKLKISDGKTVVASAGGSGTRTHRVKSGDTLYGIARQYGVTVGAIEEANGLDTTNLRPGQKLKIPAKG
jgi:membrane-bound lytic murein transglycosylase D